MGGALSGLVTEKSVPLKSIEKLFSGYQSQPSTECPIAGDSGGRLAASAVPQKELVEPRDHVSKLMASRVARNVLAPGQGEEN